MTSRDELSAQGSTVPFSVGGHLYLHIKARYLYTHTHKIRIPQVSLNTLVPFSLPK